MTRQLAESLIELDFPEREAARIEELNVKANEGAWSADEEAELDLYVDIADLLAYWQSRARQVLQLPA
jgi:hypothetical protein